MNIKRIIANHFGVGVKDVKQDGDAPDEYSITFTRTSILIEVVTPQAAIRNELDNIGGTLQTSFEELVTYISHDRIGIYTYLTNSNLLFRLL
jgi:hypothetical protein